MAQLNEMLQKMVEIGASDLIVKVGGYPSARVDGRVEILDKYLITSQVAQELLKEIAPQSLQDRFLQVQECDLSYDLPDVGRFRVNLFLQRGHVGMVFRHIKRRIPGFDELCLPRGPLEKIAALPRGLVIVTGVAGSGKSTTLAAVVEHINEKYQKHILTIEDPIEYLYVDKKSVISQREIGPDTPGFVSALKYCVRQSPDVILIGEMRDQETMSAAITAAETGHLVLSTLHTTNAPQTVERIISYYPVHQHDLVRQQMSLLLKGVICQRLLPRKEGQGRVPAVEIMLATPTIRELLAEGKTRSLYTAIREGTDYFGTQTFNQSLRKWYEAGVITLETALAASDNPEELELEVKGVLKGTRSKDVGSTTFIKKLPIPDSNTRK
ncbi:MAG: PilT/PilU family type 4a pilus ATPase [Planctomycetota bacterium]